MIWARRCSRSDERGIATKYAFTQLRRNNRNEKLFTRDRDDVDGRRSHGGNTSEVAAPITWIATNNFGEQAFESLEAGGTSRTNRVEVECILTLLTRWYEEAPCREWLTSQTKHPQGVGVICIYAAQRDQLWNKLLRPARRYAAAAREGRHHR